MFFNNNYLIIKMAKHYKTLAIEEKMFNYLDDCEYIYRKHHPELNNIYLTKTKILYEIIKFYLQKTERNIQE